MSERYLGLDVGTRAIRSVCLEVDGKRTTIREVREEPVELVDGTLDYHGALGRLFSRGFEHCEVTAANLPSSFALQTHKVLPFNDPKLIDAMLAPALSDQWQITDKEQLAFEIGEKKEPVNEGDESGYDILALLYPKNLIRERLELLKTVNFDPQVLLPAQNALLYGIAPLKSTINLEGYYGILDLGASESVLHVLEDDKLILSRAIKVGGQKVTETIAEHLEISIEDAERLKCSVGFVADEENAIAVCTQMMADRKISDMEIGYDEVVDACTEGVRVLASSLRQSLVSLFYSKHIEVSRIYVTGGASRLYGLLPYLSDEFEIECVPLPVDCVQGMESLNVFPWVAYSMAYAAQAGMDGNCQLNLRKGEFAHKGSLEYLKDRKWYILAVVAALIIAFIFKTSVHAQARELERNRLKDALESATESVFGQKMTSESQIRTQIASASGYDYIPERTAFSHFYWISNAFHEQLSDVSFDLSIIEINNVSKIVTIKGEVEGNDGLLRILGVLESYECFPSEIAEPKTQMVREKTSFNLKIEATHCKIGGENSNE